LGSTPVEGTSSSTRKPRDNRLLRKIGLLTRRLAWKADFNQCTGRQLSEAVKRAARIPDPGGHEQLPFVLIGHSKLFTEANEQGLTRFLDYVVRNPTLFRFGTFHDICCGIHAREN